METGHYSRRGGRESAARHRIQLRSAPTYFAALSRSRLTLPRALLVYRELTVSVFLTVQDNITLPAVIWSYWYAGGINKASAVTLLMTLVLTPLILVFWWFGRRSQVSVQ